MKAGIIGATGYGGAELIRILHSHPEFRVHSIYSSSQEGKELASHYPHLSGVIQCPLEKIDAKAISKDTDIVFLAVPAGISAELSPLLVEAGCTVVDLSGDFRIQDREQYEKWYKKPAAEQEWLEKACYALPEINRGEIEGARFISNPGCYPTAVLLGLAPAIQKGLILEDTLIIDAKSGVSGAGQATSFATIYNELNENLKVYKVNEHQHIPEIEQMLSQWGYESPITFQTHLIPMTRGIMTTMYGKLTKDIGQEEFHGLYKDHYAGESFVRVRESGMFPATKEVKGSNFCDIGVAVDERTGRFTIVSVIDNLMKGAAGQAVQNANIICGFDEMTGLELLPVYP